MVSAGDTHTQTRLTLDTGEGGALGDSGADFLRSNSQDLDGLHAGTSNTSRGG